MTHLNTNIDPAQLITPMLAVQGLAGRQSEERIDYNLKSQVLVQLGQFGGIVFAVIATGGGLFLLARSLVWVVAQFTELTAILAAGIIGAFALIVGRLLRGAFDLAGWYERGWHGFGEWLGATTITLLVLSLVQAIAEDWTWKQGLPLLGGIGCIIGGMFLLWRFTNELRNPAYPAPPVIDLLRDIVARMWPAEPEPAHGRLVPYRRGNEAGVVAVGAGMLHEDDMDLLEFTEHAAQVGLSRRVWLGQTLAGTGNLVTQDRYNALIRRLIEFGYVRPGGEGRAATWAIDPQIAIEQLRRQAEELIQEG